MGSFFAPKPQVIERAAAKPATTADPRVAESKRKFKIAQLNKKGRKEDVKTQFGGEDTPVDRPEAETFGAA